jgi:hypothetical protein
MIGALTDVERPVMQILTRQQAKERATATSIPTTCEDRAAGQRLPVAIVLRQRPELEGYVLAADPVLAAVRILSL